MVSACVCEAKRDRQFGTRLEGPPNLGTDEPSVFLAAIGGESSLYEGGIEAGRDNFETEIAHVQSLSIMVI